MALDWNIVEDLNVRARPIERREVRGTLCERCNSGQVYRRNRSTGKGSQAGEAVTFCRRMGHRVPNDIVECSGYEDANALSMEDLARIALTVDPRKGVDDKSYI